MPQRLKSQRKAKESRRISRELQQKLGIPPGWKRKRDLINISKEEVLVKTKLSEPGLPKEVYKLVLVGAPSMSFQKESWIAWIAKIMSVFFKTEEQAKKVLWSVYSGREVVLVSSSSMAELAEIRDKLGWPIESSTVIRQ